MIFFKVFHVLVVVKGDGQEEALNGRDRNDRRLNSLWNRYQHR